MKEKAETKGRKARKNGRKEGREEKWMELKGAGAERRRNKKNVLRIKKLKKTQRCTYSSFLAPAFSSSDWSELSRLTLASASSVTMPGTGTTTVISSSSSVKLPP